MSCQRLIPYTLRVPPTSLVATFKKSTLRITSDDEKFLAMLGMSW